MTTKPRGYFSTEERDAVLSDTAYEVSEIAKQVNEMHTCLLGIPDTEDKGLCGVVLAQKTDLESFKRDVVKGAVGIGSAVVIALIGVIAVLIGE